MDSCFDFFELEEAKIITAITCLLDGHITEDYLSEEELQKVGLSANGCIPYERVKKQCFEMIKGKRTPKFFRFVFLCPKAQMKEMFGKEGEERIANLTMNLTYSKGELFVTTSCLLRTFSLDKSAEAIWDAWVLDFLRKEEIAVEKTL